MMAPEMKDEELILMVTRTLVEEWGPDEVVISVPQPWSRHIGGGYLGSVRLEFNEAPDLITIRAGNSISRTFRLELAVH